MLNRRELLLGGAALGLAACSGGRRQSRGEPLDQPTPSAELDALVELLVTTPRDRVLERLADEIRGGLTRERLIAALLVAATRNVLTTRMFGKEQHILLSIYATERAGHQLDWRPALWSVDYFKWAQEAAKGRQDGPMDELPDNRLPSARLAPEQFRRAMDEFDGDRAETALVAMYRAGQRQPLIDLLLRYGSKDFRHIGHKVIHVANGLRTLAIVGWDHGEDVVRSMARTLALHYDAKGHDADGAWLRNQRLAGRLGADWAGGRPNDEAVVSLLAALRAADADAACDVAVDWLARGAAPQSLWDATLVSSAELMMNNPTGVEALHSVTASNAAFATYRVSKSDEDRRLLLLQNVARVADFHRYTAWWAVRRDAPPRYSVKLERLESEPAGAPAEALEQIYANIGTTPEGSLRAARQTFGLLSQHPAAEERFAARAIERAFVAGEDTHDLKLAVATTEDAKLLSPAWRARFLAACSLRFHGSSAGATPVASRIEQVLAS